MPARAIHTLVLVLIQPGNLAAQVTTNSWPPAPMAWSSPVASSVDLSHLLEGPAGKDGFIQLRNGHLADGRGKRVRFWGVNATGAGGLPAKERAALLAQLLAQRGINCVRFHMLDGVAPRGLIKAGTSTSSAFDSEALDRLDFFIAELKKRGIYANLNLNVGRRYRSGDGVRDYELIGFAKALTFFDERLLELQRDYARQLLTHVNPYTGKPYADEPAVALVEFVNENSLIEAWFGNRLLGQNIKPGDATWTDIPPGYAADLTAKYNAWLRAHVPESTIDGWRKAEGLPPGSPIPRLKPSEFSRANTERFSAEARFYLEIEAQFFTGMARFLRNELKVKSLLVGNSDHGHGKSGYPQLVGTSLLDVIDGHVYWQHPRYLNDPQTGRRRGFEIRNTPMVDDPLHSTVAELARSPLAGKPYTVSEVNHPFPAEYACEGIPILGAYAALQDWDGIFWYTLAHADITGGEPLVAAHFDIAPDPVKMAQIAAGSLMFLRGDVSAARQVVSRGYSRDQVIDSIRLPSSASPFFDADFSPALPLQHQVRISSLERSVKTTVASEASFPARSDTAELTWSTGENHTGLVLINTERSQAAVGFCGRAPVALNNFRFESDIAFCAVTVSALEEKPISQSDRLLLTAGARVANAGMEWNDARKSLTNWGKAPVQAEIVRGTIHLTGLANARAVFVQPLDTAGAPQGEAINAKRNSNPDAWSLTLGEEPAIWYLVEVRR
jgi:hypothetical protein